MATTTTAKEVEPLDHLEERIQKTVSLVHRLRDEKEAMAKSAADDRELAAMEKAEADKVADALRVDLEEAKNANLRLAAELEAMKNERQQVRSRLEKLLGHIDQLGAA
jgi:FtsZ-binding cell division protein ZapB